MTNPKKKFWFQKFFKKNEKFSYQIIRFFLPAQWFFPQNYLIFRGRSEKLGEKIGKIVKKFTKIKKKKIKPHFIITYFRAVVKPRFFYRGYQMELFRVYLKIFRPNENRVGIIENFQMKTPEGIRGYLD